MADVIKELDGWDTFGFVEPDADLFNYELSGGVHILGGNRIEMDSDPANGAAVWNLPFTTKRNCRLYGFGVWLQSRPPGFSVNAGAPCSIRDFATNTVHIIDGQAVRHQDTAISPDPGFWIDDVYEFDTPTVLLAGTYRLNLRTAAVGPDSCLGCDQGAGDPDGIVSWCPSVSPSGDINPPPPGLTFAMPFRLIGEYT